MAILKLCRGLQASGKSTWAKNLVKENAGWVRLNRDDIRSMFGAPWSRELEEIVKNVEYSAMIEFFKQGYNVVIDDVSNLNDGTIVRINKEIKQLEGIEVNIEYQDFFIPVEECIQRDKLRANPIGEKVIKSTWRQYKDKILGILNRNHIDSIAEQDTTLPHCIIVDLDGTIALSCNRPFYGEGCAEGIANDYPVTNLINLISNYKGTVFFLTGREATPDISKATSDWLDKQFNLEHMDARLLMRHQGDYTSGPECKKQLFEKIIKGNFYIDFILEDSDKVVEMWREQGLLTLQPANNYF